MKICSAASWLPNILSRQCCIISGDLLEIFLSVPCATTQKDSQKKVARDEGVCDYRL